MAIDGFTSSLTFMMVQVLYNLYVIDGFTSSLTLYDGTSSFMMVQVLYALYVIDRLL